MLVKNIFLLFVIVLFSALGITTANAEGKCKDLLTTVCNGCHNTDPVCANLGGTEKTWAAIIDLMIANGTELSDEQQTLMINCLSEPYDEAKKACGK